MKNIVFIWIMSVLAIIFAGCSDNEKGDIKPSPLTNYTVTPINGGARITYPVPNDDNVLYVMAEYERNGKVWTERSSIYNNSLTVQGFDTREEVTVQLYTVNYHERRSDPVSVSFTPLESPLSIAFNTLDVSAGFGGVFASWENPSQTELGVRVMVEEEGELVEKEMYFSSFSETGRPFRQYDDIETVFALSFEDKYGNVSEIKRYTLTPLPEIHIQMPSNVSWQVGWDAHESLKTRIPYDNYTENATVNRTKVFNDVTHAPGSTGLYEGWLTVATTELNVSPIFTIDLGARVANTDKVPGSTYKLSRMRIWPRMQGDLGGSQPYRVNQVFGVNNVLAFEVYGIKEFPTNKLTDKGYWLESYTEKSFNHPDVEVSSPSFTDEWVHLGRFEIERLDLMGASEADIVQRALDGFEFTFPLDAEPVRYLRFIVLETDKGTPTPNSLFQFAELRFWGTDKITP